MPEHFAPQDAAQALAQGMRIEGPLRQRTEGLSMAVWGLALGGMFATYGWVHATQGHDGNPWLGFLWAPWALLGALLSGTMWRSARLVAPALPAASRPRWLEGVVFASAYAAAVGLAFWLADDVGTEAFAVLAVGAVWTLFALLDLRKSSPLGRGLRLAVGGLLFVAGLLVAAMPSLNAFPVALAVGVAAPSAAGLAQAWRA